MENAVSDKTGLQWLWLSFMVVILDQLSKYLIVHHLSFHEPFYLMPVLNFMLAHNKGAAFGFLSHMENVATLLFAVIALVISLVLFLWLCRLPFKNYWMGISLSLILGGALGNLIDRLRLGYVVDFVHLHIRDWSWPIFNVADIAITVGAILLLIDIFRRKKDENSTR